MKIQVLLASLALGGSAASSPTTAIDATTRAERLHQAAERLPDITRGGADQAVDAALLVETRAIPAELLVSIAWGESRFKADTKTGHACGLVQVVAYDTNVCELLKIPFVGMLVGRLELEQWLHYAKGDIRLALLGNACGWSGIEGACSKMSWPDWVLTRARRLRDVGPKS